MENKGTFDALITMVGGGKPTAGEFDKEKWGQQKQAERESIYALLDGQTEAVFADPELMKQYIKVQGNMLRMSTNNALLIAAQNPDATKVLSYDRWGEYNRSVKRGETGLRVIIQNGEYEKKDGSGKATSFTIGKMFDVTQTAGKPLKDFRTIAAKLDEKVHSLVVSMPVKTVVDQTGNVCGVVWNEKAGVVEVEPGLPGEMLFTGLARAYLTITGARETGNDVPTHEVAIAAGMVCERYKIPYTMELKPLTAETPKDMRAMLNRCRNAADGLATEIDAKMQEKWRSEKEKDKAKAEPER